MKLANGFGWALAAAAMVAAPCAEGAFQVKLLYDANDVISGRADYFDIELGVYSAATTSPDAQGSCLTYVVEGDGIDCSDNLDEGGNHRTLDGVYDVEQANHPMVEFDDRGWATVKAKLGEKDVLRVTGVFGPYDPTFVSSAPNGKDQRMTLSIDHPLTGMPFYVIERDPGIYEPTGHVYTGDDATADPNVSTAGMTETQKLSASEPNPADSNDTIPAGALLVQGATTGSSQTVFVVNKIDDTMVGEDFGVFKTRVAAGGNIVLSTNLVCKTQEAWPIVVPGGVAVSLDLNGHTIDRGLTNSVRKGGVFVVRSNGSLAISDSKGGGTITGGKTSGDGGGVLVESGGSFTMTGGTFAGNVAEGRGGAIHSAGALRVTGSAFVGNEAALGGAIHTDGTNVVINHNAFIGNHASNGNTIVCDDPPLSGPNVSNASLEHAGFADNNWFGNFESDFAATPTDITDKWWFLRIEREIDGTSGRYRLKAVPCLYSSTSRNVLEVPDPADYRLPPITLNCFATNAVFDGATATNPATIRLSREGHVAAAFEPQFAAGGSTYTVGVVVPGYESLSESLTFEHSGAADDDETTSVRIVKVWDDDSGRAGRRPSSVSFTLAGGSFETNVVLDCSGGADRVETTVSGVPRYEGGSEIAYSLVEDPVPGDYRAVVVDEGKVVPETVVEPGVSLSLTVNGEQNVRIGEGGTLNFLATLSGADPVGSVDWSWDSGSDSHTARTDLSGAGEATLARTYEELKTLATAGEEYVMTATYRTNGFEAARARVPFGLLDENPAVVFVEPALDETFYVGQAIGFKVLGYMGGNSTSLTLKWQCASTQLSDGYSAPANGTTETELAFREAGDHAVTVTVSDQDSKTGSATIVVHVVEPPEPIQSFSVTNSYAPPPAVTLSTPGGLATFSEGSTGPALGRIDVGLTTLPTADITVHLDVCRVGVGTDNYPRPELSSYYIEFGSGSPTNQAVYFEWLDGTSAGARDGYLLTASVTNGTAGPSGVAWKDFYAPGAMTNFVANEAPQIMSFAPTDASAVVAGVPFTISYSVRDVPADFAAGLTLAWTTSEGFTTSYQVTATSVSNYVDYAATSPSFSFSSPGPHSVSLVVEDKDQGKAEAVFDVTVLPPPAPPVVSNVVARQRWPWNGLVDVDYEVGGDTNLLAGLAAQITFTDSDGRSWVASTFLAGAEPSAEPGPHRATWNAAADAGAGVMASNAIATVSLVRAPEPRWCVIDLSGGSAASSYPVTYVTDVPNVPGGFNADAYKTTNLVLRLVKPSDWADGTFTMGGSCEATLTNAFWIGVFETTQRQWELVSGGRPSYFRRDDGYATRPVEKVSYEMIRGSDAGSMWPDSGDVDEDSFLGKLRARTGLAFDLPTEAQWEFACRATTTTDYNNGSDWTDGTSCTNLDPLGRYWFNGGGGGNGNPDCDTSGGTAAVGSYRPNEWGLYDCHGNVDEWCLDWFGDFAASAVEPVGAPSGEKRVLRGGCWIDNAVNCRSTGRIGLTPDFVGNYYGFRLCLPAVAETAAAAAASAAFRLDTREGPFESDGTETLTYSSIWHGDTNATVTILQNGDEDEPVASGLLDEGDAVWQVFEDGTYVLTHVTTTNVAVSPVCNEETATFVVRGHPLVEAALRWKYAKNANGWHCAQVALTWHPSYADEISDMRLLFADRYEDSEPLAVIKTLDDGQAAFFEVPEMIKLAGDDWKYYFLNDENGKVYSERFLEGGYREKLEERPTVSDGDEAGTLTSWGGSDDSTRYITNGVLNADGTSFSHGITVNGRTVTLKFASKPHGLGRRTAYLVDPATVIDPLGTTETYRDVEYRAAPVDLTAFAGLADGARAVYGVSDATMSSSLDSVPQAERKICLRVANRDISTVGRADNKLAILAWKVGGLPRFLPIAETMSSLQDGGGVHQPAQQPAQQPAPRPLSVAEANLSAAFGLAPAAVARGAVTCRVSSMSFAEDGSVEGTFAVAAENAGGVVAESGELAGNVTLSVLGAESLGGAFEPLDASAGAELLSRKPPYAFRVKAPGKNAFFKVLLDAEDVFE